MDLTIIIPYFNSYNSLVVLLNSIPNLSNVQILVINDKSTKNKDEYMSLKNIKNYEHITFIDNETAKKGAGTCRNIGLKYALGRWVLFADADDFFMENFYQAVNLYFDSEFDVIFFPPTSQDQLSKKISYRHVYYKEIMLNYLEENNFKNELFLRYRIEVPWSKLIKLSFIKENNINFDDTLVSNDTMFSTKIGYSMRTFYVDTKIIYCVTENHGSLTKQISEEVFNTRLEVFIRVHNFLKQNLTNTEFKELELTGTTFLISAFKYKIKLITLVRLLITLKRNRIKLIKKKYLNPVFVFYKVKEYDRIYKLEKRYYTKEK